MTLAEYNRYSEAERSWLEEPDHSPHEDEGPDPDEEYERWRDEQRDAS